MAKNYYAGEPSTVSSGPSAALWADCPVIDMIQDPSVGSYYFEDFTGPLATATGYGLTVTAVTSGSASITDAAYGALLLDSAGNASADDGVQAQWTGERWLPAVGKTLWFEARVKFSDWATTPDQSFIGLAATDTTLIASGELDESGNIIGFHTDANSTAEALEFACVKAGASTVDTAIATVANDTYVKLGFKIETVEGVLVLTPYVNGVAQTADQVTATYIPVTEMTLSLVSQCEQTSADAEMTVDWIRIAQLR